MATPDKTKITETTKLADLTVGEFRLLFRELMQEVIWEIEQMLPDPDEGKELKPEVAEYLLKSAEEKGPYKTLDDVAHELALDE